MFCSNPFMSLLVAHLFSYKGLNLIMWHYKQTRKWCIFIKHNIFNLLFIEIHKFKKKKILEEDEDETNDQQSDGEQTGNEWNGNYTLFAFLECSGNCTVPGEGYIRSERRPTGVTHQHAANQPLTT